MRKTNPFLDKSITFIRHLNGNCRKNQAGIYIKVRGFNIPLFLLNTSSTSLRFAKFIFQHPYSFSFSSQRDIFHYFYYIQAGFIIFASIEICLFPLISLCYQPKIISFLGSGPNMGRSPVEWGDFPSVHLSVQLFIPPSGPSSQA